MIYSWQLTEAGRSFLPNFIQLRPAGCGDQSRWRWCWRRYSLDDKACRMTVSRCKIDDQMFSKEQCTPGSLLHNVNHVNVRLEKVISSTSRSVGSKVVQRDSWSFSTSHAQSPFHFSKSSRRFNQESDFRGAEKSRREPDETLALSLTIPGNSADPSRSLLRASPVAQAEGQVLHPGANDVPSFLSLLTSTPRLSFPSSTSRSFHFTSPGERKYNIL